MDLDLVRNSNRSDGIFSQLLTADEEHSVCMTLEHAYPGKNDFQPKLPNGTFICKRGKHRLHGMTEDFETFEITGVEGHSGMLFHWGNLNRDSEGCVLTGDAIAEYPAGAPHTEMITNSRAAFARFMKLQEGADQFTLRVF